MFKLFIALNIILLNLLACKGGFDSCKLKTIDAAVIKDDMVEIPVDINKRLIFSKYTPNYKILKYDPYLNLYLVEDKTKYPYPFRVNHKLTLGTAGVCDKKVIEGKIVQEQVGLNHFATYTQKLIVPSLLLNSCCALEGIVTDKGIIEKEYIDRFLQVKKVTYADIGIRVKDDKKLALVKATNPFMKNNPLKIDDYILEFDGVRVKNSAQLMRTILFSKIGSKHKLKIKRGKKILNLKVKSLKRYGGGYLSDTFLELLGVSFDKNLFILKIEKNAQRYGLEVGDQLLQINGKRIKNEKNIFEEMNGNQKSVNLLFQRREFQFFIRVD